MKSVTMEVVAMEVKVAREEKVTTVVTTVVTNTVTM